jgi:hypothetical protein
MEKGHKSNYLHRIWDKLTEFHHFGKSLFHQGFIKKRKKDIKNVGLKSIFLHGTKLRRL